ncbi:hypothetical protein ACFL0X_00275 [Nanoarchaeota archaeon]
MEWGFTLFVVVALIAVVYIFIEIKRLKHKLFAIFLIALILFSYISFSVVLKDKDIDYKTTSGMTEASKVYFSWLGSLFGNVKTITTNAVGMDWSSNQTET